MIEPTGEIRKAFKADHEDACDGIGCGRDACLDVRLAAVLAIVERDEVGPLRELLAQLVDEDPCWLDHHGYCQAHSLHSPPCPHRVARELLGGPS